jgi:hypothetical protein
LRTAPALAAAFLRAVPVFIELDVIRWEPTKNRDRRSSRVGARQYRAVLALMACTFKSASPRGLPVAARWRGFVLWHHATRDVGNQSPLVRLLRQAARRQDGV